MADIDYYVTIRFDGLDAEAHELDLFALGESLKGIARIAAVAGNFALTQKYSRYFTAHDVKVVAREPKANCFSMQVVWNFVQQQQILSGAFGVIAAALITWVLSSAAQKREEMKQIKDSLDKAIRELGNRDEATIARLLDIVEKMAVDLRSSARQAVAPLGSSAKTLTVSTGDHTISRTYDEADAAAINKGKDDELTDLRAATVLITELDLERGTCKVHLDGEEAGKRFPAVITDPLLQIPNNSYALAFAAGEKIDVKAKFLLKQGDISRLYISDVGI